MAPALCIQENNLQTPNKILASTCTTHTLLSELSEIQRQRSDSNAQYSNKTPLIRLYYPVSRYSTICYNIIATRPPSVCAESMVHVRRLQCNAWIQSDHHHHDRRQPSLSCWRQLRVCSCHQYVHSSTTQYTESLLHGYGLRPGVKPSLYWLLAPRPARDALARSVPAASPGLIVRCPIARHPSRTARRPHHAQHTAHRTPHTARGAGSCNGNGICGPAAISDRALPTQCGAATYRTRAARMR